MIKLIQKKQVFNGTAKATGKPFQSITWLVESNGRQMEAKVFGNKVTNAWVEGMSVDATLTNGKYGMEIVLPKIEKADAPITSSQATENSGNIQKQLDRMENKIDQLLNHLNLGDDIPL